MVRRKWDKCRQTHFKTGMLREAVNAEHNLEKREIFSVIFELLTHLLL
jgi:hypothetical protein